MNGKPILTLIFIMSCVAVHADTYTQVCQFLDMCHGQRPKVVIVDSNIAQRAFYASETNTIYVRADSVTNGVLAHEYAHAILAEYGCYTMSVKAQEIVAGYMEWIINKEGK